MIDEKMTKEQSDELTKKAIALAEDLYNTYGPFKAERIFQDMRSRLHTLRKIQVDKMKAEAEELASHASAVMALDF
jgi:hypothetical protein